MRLTKLFSDFFESERAGGIILIIATIVSMALANSYSGPEYIQFWNKEIGGHSITHWINDGLMAIFFLLIGLELERELYKGELSNLKNATLPIFAAIGGMIVPATIFLLFNWNSSSRSGAGIPMATDIAFAIGILSLLGNRVPLSLKVFLTALAVMDDLGAILVIAIFYTKTLVWMNLIIALSIFSVLLVLNRLKVHNLIPYLIGGIAMWYFMLHSGVHATITGVLLAFALPFSTGERRSSSYILQHFLHKPVAFLILPIFAVANTCIPLGTNWTSGLADKSSIGILVGLVIGKPLGIFLFSVLGVIIGICKLPEGVRWKHIMSIGFLGGIGFTMSIFITLLAFEQSGVINNSKIAILVASLLAGVVGLILLKLTINDETAQNEHIETD